MGQKVNPISMRLPINKQWNSRWFASSGAKYKSQLQNDFKIIEIINEKAGLQSAIDKIFIERTTEKTKISIVTGRPGVLIGRSGQGVENITAEIRKIVPGKVDVEIIELRKPDLSALVVAQNIGQQISRRVAYKKAIKMTMQKVMQAGALGIKVAVAGRLNGAEIARTEKFNLGSIPLSTLRANIDFAVHHARTTYGTIGIKVWILKKPEAKLEE